MCVLFRKRQATIKCVSNSMMKPHFINVIARIYTFKIQMFPLIHRFSLDIPKIRYMTIKYFYSIFQIEITFGLVDLNKHGNFL